MKMRQCAGAVVLVLSWMGSAAVWGQDAVGQLEKGLGVPLAAPETAAQVVADTGYLGLSVDLAAPAGKAVFVTAVAEGGPAQQAGLQVDDVIVAINDTPIGSIEDMDRVARQPAGTKLVFEIRRGDVVQKHEVTLGVRPADAAPPGPVAELPEPAPADAEPAEVADGTRPSLGISVDDVSELTRRRFSVTVSAGAVITRIRAGSPAARAGLPLGGVIVSVNGKRIGSANDIVNFIQAFRPGDEIEVTYFEGDRIGRKKLRLAPTDLTAVAARRRPRANGLTTDPRDPPLQLGQRRLPPKPRSVVEALERKLDGVLPPTNAADESGGRSGVAPSLPLPPEPGGAAAGATGEDAAVPPLPPAPGKTGGRRAGPIPAGTPETPPLLDNDGMKSILVPDDTAAPADPDAELATLRRQADSLKQQLEQIQRRIQELEKAKRG
jgi:hypothetical protein